MASIRLENVTKSFKNTTAVNDISLMIADGEFFCILGPPGAGKTTLLRLIVGLEKPDGGNIIIGDDTVNNVHPSKRDIAMIFQNLALYPDKTVFENIAFPCSKRYHPSSPVVNGSAWRSDVPSSGSPRPISWTSLSPTSTPCSGSKCALR